MVGTCGGTVSLSAMDRMQSEMVSEAWYETDSLSTNLYEVGTLHHGTAAGEPTVGTGGDVDGMLFGSVTNQSSIGDEGALFDALGEEPAETLAMLDGSFLVV
jgi:hypothetical protein